MSARCRCVLADPDGVRSAGWQPDGRIFGRAVGSAVAPDGRVLARVDLARRATELYHEAMEYYGLGARRLRSKPLSAAAHAVLVVLRDPQAYDVPYAPTGSFGERYVKRGAGWRLCGPWVPITYLHYEAGQHDGHALAVLRELEDRGIRLEASIDPTLGMRVRLP